MISVYTTVTHIPVSIHDIKKVVAAILIQEKKEGDISIHCIGDARMKTLNRIHRGKDDATDVLSFATQEGEYMSTQEKDIGDIFLCVPYIHRQAQYFEVTEREEFIRMLVHGVLHTLGYDHITASQAQRMFPLQETYVESFVTQKI